MHIERFFVPGLAHASYLVASGNEAVAVDPERNVDASRDGLRVGTCQTSEEGVSFSLHFYLLS
jgi:hypothetical protein